MATVTTRTFGQFCGVARALELVGERWALPRIPTNVLTDRLNELFSAFRRDPLLYPTRRRNRMISEPSLVDRPAQPYVAIRHQVTMQEFGSVIDQTFPQLFAWLGAAGVPPAGAPFIRYLVINMADKLDVELGVPVPGELSSVDGPVAVGVLPPGRYAALVYTGSYDGLMGANAALLDWGAAKGLQWDAWTAPNGDGFGARLETYLTHPRSEPDPSQWKTEVAIRVADSTNV